MSNAWLIKVNATKYNILGGIRDFSENMPWYFDVEDQIEEGDVVYFYLTDSKGKNTVNQSSVVDNIFKRFILKGIIISADDQNLDLDEEYWTDEEYKNFIESKPHKYATIKITKDLWDYNIKSDNVAKEIWNGKYAYKDSYKLDLNMISSIEKNIKQCQSNHQ